MNTYFTKKYASTSERSDRFWAESEKDERNTGNKGFESFKMNEVLSFESRQ